MEKQFLNAKGAFGSPAFSQVAMVRGGKTIYVSGQVALDEKGELVGRGDLRAQTRKAFENLKLALAAAGADFENVVKMNYYIVGYRPEHLAPIREVRSEYLSRTHPPASTLVGVTSLVQPELLLEIEVVAAVGS